MSTQTTIILVLLVALVVIAIASLSMRFGRKRRRSRRSKRKAFFKFISKFFRKRSRRRKKNGAPKGTRRRSSGSAAKSSSRSDLKDVPKGIYGSNVDLYHKANDGDVQAQYELGICYQKGNGVKQDAKQAVFWLQKAAEQNHAEAQYSLACCYLNGRGVKKDRYDASKLLKTAAQQGHYEALKELADLIIKEHGDYFGDLDKQELYWLNKAAEQGYDEAQYAFGKYMVEDINVCDDVEAAEWFFKAALQGNYKADEMLLSYDFINDEDESMAEIAIPYLIELANDGDEWAIDIIGHYVGCGLIGHYVGCLVDCDEYINSHKISADTKFKIACSSYENDGLEYGDDPILWCEKAAEEGHAEAKSKLASWCYKRAEITDDDDEYENLLRKAAELGHPDAQRELKKLAKKINKKIDN